jgi:hypothetical protein
VGFTISDDAQVLEEENVRSERGNSRSDCFFVDAGKIMFSL